MKINYVNYVNYGKLFYMKYMRIRTNLLETQLEFTFHNYMTLYVNNLKFLNALSNSFCKNVIKIKWL